MAFKIPSLEEMEQVHEQTGRTQAPSLFQAGQVTKPANGSTAHAVSEAQEPAAEECPSTSVTRVDEVSSAERQDASTRCSATSNGSSVAVASASTDSATNIDDVAQTSKGVVIRPVTTAAESNGKGTSSRQPKANSIIVSLRQRGNPILKFVRNVPWEFGEVVPDYQLGCTSCALYLSLRYHNLKPNYIHERLRQLANSYVLRVLLVQVDVKDCDHALKELAKICLLADCTMVAAFTFEEAGRYLETYKSYESKPADLIMEKSEGTYMSRVCDTLTSVKKVNKTDAVTLLSTFGSVKQIVEASEEQLALCPGLGPQKASRIHDVFTQPFLKGSKRSQPAVQEQTSTEK